MDATDYALPVLSLVTTKREVYDHRGERLPKGTMGTVMIARRKLDGTEDCYEVELISEGGRMRRMFTATSAELELIAAPVAGNA